MSLRQSATHINYKRNLTILSNIKIKTLKTMAEEKVVGVKPNVVSEEKVTTEIYRDIFVLVTRNAKTQIAIRNNIIWRDEFESVQAAKDFIDDKPWGLIVNTVLFIYEDLKNMK